jgi:hypothetical protein
MNIEIKPNTFLIGVQKSATSSLYNWISQHEDICAPSSLKDIPFFSDDRLFEKGFSIFNEVYPKYYKEQKVVFHGNVNYIFFENALERIKQYNPNAKFVLVLRNPIHRAMSAYHFAVRRGMEKADILEAFRNEEQILEHGTYQELSDLTYKAHGLYFKQIQVFEKYFKKDQLCIVLFEDLKANPQNVLKNIFNFLGVDDTFKPQLNYLNETGEPRNKFVNGLIYKESKFKKVLMENVFNKIVSFDTKVKMKLLIGKLMTKNKKGTKQEIPEELKADLTQYYKSDIENLEKYLEIDLSNWK